MSAAGHDAAEQQAAWNPALRPNTEEEAAAAAASVSIAESASSIEATAVASSERSASQHQHASSRHFAQSASIHQVPESEEIESVQEQEVDEAFGDLPEQGIDYTNSFPVVAQSSALHLPETPPEPLPQSQAENVLAEEDRAAETETLEETSVLAQAQNGIDWGSGGDEDFLSNANGGHDVSLEAHSAEARFEEGVPLIHGEQDEQAADHKAPVDLDWGDGAAEGTADDDFFGGSANGDNFMPPQLDRKSTEQVLGSMQYPPHSSTHGKETDSSAQDSGIEMNSTHFAEDIDYESTEAPAQAPDLAAAWGEALGDDDLLAEDNTVDPSAFFEDDGEGFLDEGALSQQTPSTVQQKAVNEPQRYAPNGNQPFPSRQVQVSAYGQPPRPELSKAQSFVDKAKGGYESPYDLPMDLRPKRQPAARQSTGSAQRSPQMPPPRSSSITSPVPPPPQSPYGSPQPATPGRPAPTSAKSAAFFEELPMTAKPTRPSSAARFASVGPPSAPPPPSSQATQPPPPPRPNAPNNQTPPDFSHGLFMPQRSLSFGEESGQQPGVPSPPKATNRYSPAPAAQTSQTSLPAAHGRYSNPPPGPSRTSSANFVPPFQPRTSSPLARRTSVSNGPITPTAALQDRVITGIAPQLSPPPEHGAGRSPEKQRSVPDQSTAIPSYQQTGTVVRHRRAPSLIKQYAPPSDDRAQDPLERWKGGPIFKFGTAGIVSCFPVETPRFSIGSTQPLYMVNPGEVKLRSAKTLIMADENILSFPGPLKAKGKKKDLLAWLSKRVATLKEQALSPDSTVASELSQQRREDRLVLLQILTALVEYDGNFETNPASTAALRSILAPLPQIDPQAGAANYGSEVHTGITRSNTSPPSHSTDVEAVEEIRKLLLAGEREKAAWHAADRNLWGQAMLIASTLQGETWKQVVHEFVRKEVRTCGNNTEAISALYDVFSGNWDECADQLVPAAARSGFQMVSTTGTMSAQNALAGLDKWQETLALIVSNRTSGDAKAIISLGELLANYGRAEAAHVCYIVAKMPGLLTGADDPTAHAVLLGANHRQQSFDIHKDTDAIIATEVFEFAMNVLSGGQSTQPMQYLVPYKLQHASILADAGRREEAQAYCEVVTASIKANKMSPYLHPQLLGVLDDLVTRLSQAPKEASKSWLANPKMGDVSNSLFNRFNKFVSGDDNDAAAAGSVPAGEQGPFGAVAGEPITISRTASPALNGGGLVSQGGYAPAVQAPGASSRYAPGVPAYSTSPANSYTPSQHRDSSGSLPRMSPDHFRKMPPSAYQSAGAYTPTSGLASAPRSYSPGSSQAVPAFAAAPAHNSDTLTAISDNSRPGSSDDTHIQPPPPQPGRRTSYEPLSVPKPGRDRNSSSYQPRSNGFESRSSSYAPRSGSYAPRSYAPSPAASERQPEDISRQSSGSYMPQAPLMEDQPQEDQVVSTSDVQANTNEMAAEGQAAQITEASHSNGEAPINFGGYDPSPSYGYQPTPIEANASEVAQGGEAAGSEQPAPSYGQSYEPPAPAEGGDDAGSYQPPSFGSYEPPSSGYQPYEPDTPSSPAETKPKKKGIMDLSDDEDDMSAKAAALKKEEKARKDKEAEEAFRRAAEEDAKRDGANKAGNRGSWFGGWLGGKKRESSVGPEPTVHRAKLGEESSFVYDETLKKWVNKKAGTEAATEKTATPPPPRGGPPSRSSSVGPPMGGPPRSIPAGLGLGATPPSRTSSPLVNMTTVAEAGPTSAAMGAPPMRTPPIGGPPLAGGLAPPSRPGTGMSGVSTGSSIDDLLGGPPGGARKTSGKKGKKGGRYVDVMAQ